MPASSLKRLHEIVDQNGLEGPDALFLNLNVIGEIATSAEIDDGRAQRLVEGHGGLAKAADTRRGRQAPA